MAETVEDRDWWRRVEEVFSRAVELPEHERAAYLETACGDDATLRAEVESLLQHEASSQEGLNRVLAEAAASYASEPQTNPDIGLRVGHFQIVRELARGGMGVVYLGVRTDSDYAQVVAIKLIRSGLRSDRFVRRFRAERQFLASLHHPNIAMILDGGSTADGRPYIVLEYIEGEPITSYCRKKQLELTRRVQLMETVSKAVGYAHKHRVLHRDLKPENILVTREEVVKLVDFGIAKLLEPDSEHARQTTSSFRFLTPAYASPEQIAGTPVSPPTDVYSLGIILYEVITGRHPWEEFRSTPYKLFVEANRKPPPPPSRAPGGLAELKRRIDPDLDNIVMKAMARDPQQRYATAAELAADLERWRLQLPVSVSKNTWHSRLSRAVRRNPVTSAAVGAAVVLAAALAGVIWNYSIESRQWRASAYPELARARHFAAMELAAGGDLEAAAEAFAECLRYLDLAADAGAGNGEVLASLQARCYTGAAWAAMRRDQADKAGAMAARAVAAAQTAHQPVLLAAALFADGDARSRRGDVKGADDRYRAACELTVPGMDLLLAAPTPETARLWLARCQDSSAADFPVPAGENTP